MVPVTMMVPVSTVPGTVIVSVFITVSLIVIPFAVIIFGSVRIGHFVRAVISFAIEPSVRKSSAVGCPNVKSSVKAAISVKRGRRVALKQP